PWSAGRDGNQNSALHAYIASICGAPCGNPTSRMPGPDIILDHGRPGGEASGVPRLLQRLPLSCRIARKAARTSCRRTRKAGEPYLVSVAEALSRPLPDADRRVIL